MIQPGSQLGQYEILSALGRGGMGEVWKARDTKLGREVAIKTLPDEFARDPERLTRFDREARLLASLNHPGIAAIYGLEEQDDVRYLVLELVEGETLAERLERGAIPVEESLALAQQVTDALDAAHASGVIHRDIKPANIKITPAGRAKVLDFGLAKHHVDTGDDAPTMAGSVTSTEPGQIIGTVAYMSPEQAEGRDLDSRSDIFSFGIVLYEMLCGRRPFAGATTVSTLASILRDAPRSPHEVHAEITDSLSRVVLRALEKDPASRFASAHDFNQALAACRKAGPAWVRRGSLVTAIAVAVIGVAGVLGGLAIRDASSVARAEDAIPQIDRLLTEGRPWAALKLYREAEQHIPGSRELHLFDDALRAGAPMRIETDPPGAAIYLTDYADPDDDWERVGTSPVDVDDVPARGYYRIRAELDGYAPTEWSPPGRQISMTLHAEEATPERMVWVPGLDQAAPAVLGGPGVPLDYALEDFWLAEYEVTNREYQEFVDAGGYETTEYWNEVFLRDGVPIGWADAMDAFVDATGSPGPATWEFGRYPEGEADFPVSGVSWYEAMAFSEFEGMRLPTIHHWYRAAGATGFFGGITRFSNLGGSGPQEVGGGGIAAYGARDMAGNVKEWVATPDRSELRYILGASWQEAPYAFAQPDARQPIAREADFGFRLARYPEGPEVVVDVGFGAPGEPVPFIDDATFEIYRAQLSYDRIELEVRREQRESASPFVRQERLWLRLPGRDEERIMAHLFLPLDSEPPFQVVTVFGSGGVLQAPSIDQLGDPFRFLVRLGRAVVVPVFDGTLERGPFRAEGPNERRDYVRNWVEDLGRVIDFLETRPEEFDTTRIGHLGQSFGAMMSPTLLVAEPRIRAAVFLSGGALPMSQEGYGVPPEVHPLIYASRVSIPVLMLNGRDDYIYPYETSQLLLFNLLGTPEDQKRLLAFDGGHINLLSNMDLVRETVNWLDQHLGPVGTNR